MHLIAVRPLEAEDVTALAIGFDVEDRGVCLSGTQVWLHVR